MIYEAGSCRNCGNTGYAGRKGIYELLKTDATIQRMCVNRASTGEIRDFALKNGLTTLRMDGWAKVCEGLTCVEEVAKTTKGDIS